MKKFEEKVDLLWEDILVKFQQKDREWLYDMNETLLNGYKIYINNQELLQKIVKMHGMLLTKIDKMETIKYSIDKMFSLGHPEYSNSMVNIGAPLNEGN